MNIVWYKECNMQFSMYDPFNLPQYKFGGQWLGFEAITLVPFEFKLINSSMLSNVQVNIYGQIDR